MHVLLWGKFRYNGITRHTLSLAGELSRKHCPVTLFMPGLPDKLKYNYGNMFQTITEKRELERKLRYNSFSLIHLQEIEELGLAKEIGQKKKLPLLATVHFPFLHSQINNTLKKELSGIITTRYHYYLSLEADACRGSFWFIPEGIDLQYCRKKAPASPSDQVLFVGEENSYDPYALQCLCRASDLSRLRLNILAPQKPKSLDGYYLGVRLDPVPFMRQFQMVITSGRAAAEAMSCGCVPVILGVKYSGIPYDDTPGDDTTAKSGKAFPDLSGTTGSDPCYKDIFYELQELLKDSERREKIKHWALDFALKNFDLKLVAEQTAQVYRKIVK